MRGRAIFDDPRTTGPERHRPDPAQEREAPEKEAPERKPREVERERERPLTFQERSERALADVGIYRVVPFRDLAEAHFGGARRAARRAVNTWVREGLARELMLEDAEGRAETVLAATRRGVFVLRGLTGGQGLAREQKLTYLRHLHRPRAGHDTAVYRVARRERERLAREGARVRRIRLEGELRGTVLGRSEAARFGLGRRAGVVERHRAAAESGLPVDAEGRVLYPDVQIEYVDAEGRRGRVNVEVVSKHYDARALGTKTAAGFRMHANGALAARRLARFRAGGMGA